MVNQGNLPGKCRPQQMLSEFQRENPAFWDYIANVRTNRGKNGLPDWPEWCFVPMAASYSFFMRGMGPGGPLASGLSIKNVLARMNQISLATALANWRIGMGVYEFDPDLADSLMQTPLKAVPVEIFYRLPEWCVYVKAPDGLADGVAGFFAHLEYDVNTGRSELRLVFDRPDAKPLPLPLHMHEETIEASLESVAKTSVAHAQEHLHLTVTEPSVDELAGIYRDYNLPACLNLLLYLCSSDADFGGEEPPSKPKEVKTKRGLRLFPASGPHFWQVGTAIGAALRQAEPAETGQAEGRAAPRPHIRRAHWHSYRVGEGRLFTRVRWLHPILVGSGKEA